VTIGADAVGGKVRQLQSGLYKQLTGKGMSSEQVQLKDEKEWLEMLVEAMTMARALVVLDDPWLPEQVRFLDPIGSTEVEHRLLLTTRIRGLAHSRATCIELSMMDKDEAVELLLDVAGITKQAYQSESADSQWPPPAAYELATECGMLPITLTITAQLVRSWGKGWEEAVLPFLQEEHGAGSGRRATTVEERIIGAGLKSLRGNPDAPAIKALFEMFAVTQEDFVHPMAVIELLWRSCCRAVANKDGGDIGLGARLKVRQWIQLLIDQSLLLGSSSKGVHLHDIVLTYLRGTRSAAELRALQKQVVEGLVTASTERTAATGRGFQDTGSTAKAFDGEEVDWYVCNVASFHVKRSMDPSMALLENGDLKRWLLLADETLVRSVAVAMGIEGLASLLSHYSATKEMVEAAKVAWAMSRVSGSREEAVKRGKAVLDLLGQAGSATAAAQQLELDIRGSLAMVMRTGPDKTQNATRVQALMAGNKSLRVDPLGVYTAMVFPKLYELFGAHPKVWDAGVVATEDTVLAGFRLQIFKGGPFFAKAAEEAVGARKEYIRMGYEVTFAACWMPARSTDEMAEMHQQYLDAQWGEDGSVLMTACMDYRLDRHCAIAQGLPFGFDIMLTFPHAQGAAEHCGNVTQMVQLFEKQLWWSPRVC
jgi:hypothetical protein